MSVGALNWAAQTPLTGSTKWTLMALANYANDDDGYCFPGQKTIATWAGVSERTVRDQLAQLERDGWIVREHRMRDGWRTSDEYVVRFDRFTPPPKQPRALRQISPVGAADSVVSTGEICRTEPSVDPSGEPSAIVDSKSQMITSVESSREQSLPGLEDESVPSARGLKITRPDVDRLVTEAVRVWRVDNPRARRDAAGARAAEQILDTFRTNPDDVIAVLRFATTDPFWGDKVMGWASLSKNYAQLRKRMATSGPASLPERPTAPTRDPSLDRYFSGSQGDTERSRLFLSRSIDPSRFFDQGRDQERLIRQTLATAPTYAPGTDDLEKLIIAWAFRGEGQTLTGAVPGWQARRV